MRQLLVSNDGVLGNPHSKPTIISAKSLFLRSFPQSTSPPERPDNTGVIQRAPILLRAVLALTLGVAAMLPPSPAHGQTINARLAERGQLKPQGRERLIARFDFEEREKQNFEELPLHWFPIGRPRQGEDVGFARFKLHQEAMKRPGFPIYGDVRFDDREKTSGKNSFYLGLNGGSAGAFLEVGSVPVVPNSDYLITASVRTTVLEHARARLVAYFVDGKGQKIEGSEAASELTRTDNRWDTLSVSLRGDFGKAAWIGMEVQLLQPREQLTAPPSKHQVVYEDVEGGAWFDDIAIWQLPHVMVETQSRVNIIRTPERPKLTLQVRDLSGRQLDAMVTIFDEAMKPVVTTHQPAGNGAPSLWKMVPELPGYGWYLVDLIVREPASADATPVARAQTAFLWLDDESLLSVSDASRFAISAAEASDDELELLPTFFDRARVDSAIVSAWSRASTVYNLEDRQARIDRILQAMAMRGRDVSLSLSPVPDELARSLDIDPRSPLLLLTKPEAAWMPYLASTVLRHGQRVRYWQWGTTRDADLFYMPDLPAVAAAATQELQSLAPQPISVLPWQINQARRRDMPSDVNYALDVPESVRPEQLGKYLEPWHESPAPSLRLTLHSPRADRVPHPARIIDLTERMLYAWEAGATGMTLDRPWATLVDRDTAIVPDPLVGVFTTVAHRLEGRRVVGHLPLGEGVECFILNGPAGGMLAAWNRAATDEDAVIDMYLGPSPAVTDVWGNRAAVKLADGKHKIVLGKTPVFIDGIDPFLALFRASFKIDKPFIESTQTTHDRGVTITNPWPRTITGSMLITQPADWRVEPRKSFFSIAAGQSLTVPIQVSFPVSELAGKKKLVARFDFQSDQHYVVDVGASFELGLKDVDFDADLVLETNPAGGMDAVVTQLITNNGNKAIALYTFANMPGFPRQERIVSRLKPGQSMVRRFRFVDGGNKSGGVIRVGLRESSGPAVLNKVVMVPEK